MNTTLKTTLMMTVLTPAMIGAAHGATITAPSCSLSAVQTAINSASAGDTVFVPSGNCSWSSTLVLPNNKKITLQGAGKNATIITGSLNFGSSGSRVTGFTFTGNPDIYTYGYGFRLDNCKLQRSTWNNIVTIKEYNSSPQQAWGLVDNNEIINGRVNAEGSPYLLSEGKQQHVLWANGLNLGGPTAIYVENNTFSAPNVANSQVAVDANYGGRVVFRYNTVNDGLFLTVHSSQEGGNRAAQSWEIYGNTVANASNTPVYAPIRMRAGTGVMFMNKITGTWSDPSILFDNVRSYAAAAQGGGLCNGSSAWDGNQDSSGYPCRDQIGRGPDNPQWDHSPVKSYTQPLIPAYVWANKNANNGEVPVGVISVSAKHIKANRDFYASNPSFNGTNGGVGCGTLAARPTSCTTGVAYWATNQSCSSLNGMVGASHTAVIDGTLYRCSSPNTWTKHFQPYTYPHPLKGSGGSTPTLPAPVLRLIGG
jgi:hypothetical protein